MKEKIKVTGVPETMIQTLYARAKETKKDDAKIKDDIAVDIVEKIDYDFSKAENDKTMGSGVIARTIVLDTMVQQYLNEHPDTIVVNIGCGLDTRCYRMKGKYSLWYNLDLPETIDIRSRFLVIVEGLSMYLSEADVKKIFSIIKKSFKTATVMIETMSPFFVKHIKEKSIEGSNAKFKWGVKNGRELEKIIPQFTWKKDLKIKPIYNVIGKLPVVQSMSNKIVVMEKR